MTLTGPGGVGKTRLALQAAGAAADRFEHGVFWVPLAPLRDPGLVLPAAAQAVGAKGTLAEHVSDHPLLLVLDNFEHLTAAADDIADLLAACPNLKVLVTSRELLRLPGEQAYPVPELRPEDGRALFVSRAIAALPSFEADADVTELCARLEQLPLALELAAARVRVLSPEQLLERLSGRLDLLKAGRGVDARQQTLRATIEWSHDLLERTRSTLRRPCRLHRRLDARRGRARLRRRRRHPAVTRRQEPRSRVVRADASSCSRRSASWRRSCSAAARHSGAATLPISSPRREAAAPGLESGQLEWFDRIDDDLPNFRAAFDWLLDNEPDDALRLADALRDFWFARGYLHEGRRWCAAALVAGGDDDSVRARLLNSASILASLQADWPETRRLAEESGRVSERLGDPASVAQSMLTLGRALLAEGDRNRALELFDEADCPCERRRRTAARRHGAVQRRLPRARTRRLRPST